MREHTEQMQLPRFLWVPFELGRPFGAPNAPDFQRRVLLSVLELLERKDGPVVLDDFRDEAPDYSPSEDEESSWACPIAFRPPVDEQPELVVATLDEMERLAAWHEIYVEERGSAAPPASGIEHKTFVGLLGQLSEGEAAPEVDSTEPIQEWLRLGCDDLRTWYLEAAQGQPGRGSSAELRAWFWCDTAAARLIASTATALRTHPSGIVTLLAARAMVPREYIPTLMPSMESKN